MAVAVPTVVAIFSENPIVIVLAGTWGENLGFYGTIIIQEIILSKRKLKTTEQKYLWTAFLKDLRNIFIEFGPAEALDSLLIRPATMYLGLNWFKNLQLGILSGKIMADLIFYIPTVIIYELRKKLLKD